MILGIIKVFRTVILPTTRKLSRRCIAMILTADMLLSSLIWSFLKPVYAWAETLPDNPAGYSIEVGEGDDIVNNWGTITVNNGQVGNNVGIVQVNNGYIEDNFGEVWNNNGVDDPNTEPVEHGVIGTNHKDGTVGSDDIVNSGGEVTDNFGTVYNATAVGNNFASGTVNGSDDCHVQNNMGTVSNIAEVNNNYGTVVVSEPVVRVVNDCTNEAIPDNLNRTDLATPPAQPATPTPFVYEEPEANNEESDGNTGDGEPAGAPVLSLVEQLLKKDYELAAVYKLTADPNSVLRSEANMKASTLYFTFDEKPVSIVNLGVQPTFTVDMLSKMLKHGGYFGFLADGDYVVINFGHPGLREDLLSMIETIESAQGDPVTDEGSDDNNVVYFNDPGVVAGVNNLTEGGGGTTSSNDSNLVNLGTGTLSIPGYEIPPITLPTTPSGVAGVRAAATRPTGVLGVNAPETKAEKAIANKTVVKPAAKKTVAQKGKKIADPETPLAATPFIDEDGMKIPWIWLLIIAALGAVGKKMYDEHKKKVMAEEEAKKYND